MRSLLFVPADSERKLARAAEAGADALILDLEDSVLPERKAAARGLAVEYLRSAVTSAACWIRVNDLRSGALEQDLAEIVPARPAGIVLPKIVAADDISTVSALLGGLEAQHGITTGGIGLLVLATETPAGVLRMHQLLDLRCARLRALSWGAEDLSSALGAGNPRRADGSWRAVYEHARTQCLLASHALELEAIDTVYVDFRNQADFARDCADSRHDGFTGRLAIHPDQVPVIHEAYTPGDAERRLAQRIVEAFASTVAAGVVSIDGKMYDLPHLKAARRLLALPSAKERSP
jgi:citrate lyase subunit beta/citryl-CoA lyase